MIHTMPNMASFSSSTSRRRRYEELDVVHDHSRSWLPPISEGARLTWTQIAQNPMPDAQPLHQEDFQGVALSIPVGIREPSNVVAVARRNPNNETSSSLPAATSSAPPIYLMKRENPQRAYAKIRKQPVSLNHHAPNWGEVLFAVVYKKSVRQGGAISLVFDVPSEADAQYVAIKQLNKNAVEDFRQRGGQEDPYKEIARMEQLGDNDHVLRHIEVLQDNEYLYIVMPKACHLGTLKDAIPWFERETMDIDRIRALFMKILRILAYLESKGVCHRDLSPDNFLFLTPDNLVAFDLGLSCQMPVWNGQRSLIFPNPEDRIVGTVAWMPPEVFRQRPYDGLQWDLWSASVCLYNMLTNQVLYRQPSYPDFSYRYFILARGLSSFPLNDRTAEVLRGLYSMATPESIQQQGSILSQAMAHINLGPDCMALLENLLHPSPADRWTLAQAMESDFVQSVIAEDIDHDD